MIRGNTVPYWAVLVLMVLVILAVGGIEAILRPPPQVIPVVEDVQVIIEQDCYPDQSIYRYYLC